MNRLEQYIRDNKKLFEEEPEAGHFERLQQKTNHKSRQVVALRWSISVAASIAILFSVGVILQKHIVEQDNRMIICENTMDMKSCYLRKMNVVAGQIEALAKKLDPWDQHQVMTDVQNILDVASNGFESEIPEELPAKQAKAILSDYYRQNLESLQSIENRLREEL